MAERLTAKPITKRPIRRRAREGASAMSRAPTVKTRAVSWMVSLRPIVLRRRPATRLAETAPNGIRLTCTNQLKNTCFFLILTSKKNLIFKF